VIESEANRFFAALQHGPRPLPLFLAMLHGETAGDPARAAAALAGLRAYQQARRPSAPQPLPAVHRQGRAALRHAGGGGDRPVVLVPSLINPPAILDLAPDRSLARWLATRGCDTWLIDWGSPEPGERELDLAGHVERLLVPLLARLPEPPVLVGYCLGGTLAWAAAAMTTVAGVATIAAPWRFAGYGHEARTAMAAMWAAGEPTCEALGLVPVELLQAGFWGLDPARTVAKFEAFGRMTADSEEARAFVRLEDWANAGAPLTLAAGRQLFEDMVARDLAGNGGWRVAGNTVDPAALPCPAVEFVSASDRIVPAATAVGLPDRRVLAAGHVGMMIGRAAPRRLWEPLAHWIDAIGDGTYPRKGALP